MFRFIHQSSGYELGAALGGFGGALAGQTEKEERQRKAALDEREFQLRYQSTQAQIEAVNARKKLDEQEFEQNSEIMGMVALGRRLDAEVSPDPIAQIVSENLTEATNTADEFASIPPENRADAANMQRGALFGGLWSKMTEYDKALVARTRPQDIPRRLADISKRIQQEEEQQKQAQADADMQNMVAQGVPVDQTQYASANTAEKKQALLADSQNAVDEAMALEQTKKELLTYYSGKMNPKAAEGEPASLLTPKERVDRNRALVKIQSAKDEKQLDAAWLAAEQILDPDGAVSRYLEMKLENEMLRGRPGTPEQQQAQGPDRPGMTPHSMGLDEFKQPGPQVAPEQMQPVAGESPPAKPGDAPQAVNGTVDVQTAAKELDALLKKSDGMKGEQKRVFAEYLKKHNMELTPELLAALAALGATKPEEKQTTKWADRGVGYQKNQ